MKESGKTRPLVGIGVFILKDGKVLLGKRKNAHGSGSWSLPGGHLEYGETWEECAVRETVEETGLKIYNARFAAVTNDIFESEGRHYITIFMKADYPGGEVQLLEPHKCEAWEWFEWSDRELPSNIFLPLENLKRSGFDPFC